MRRQLIGSSGFHVIPIVFPLTSGDNTALTCDRVRCGDADAVEFIISIGTITLSAAGTITVNACTAASSGTSTAVNFFWRVMKTTDTWSAEVQPATAATGVVVGSAGDIVGNTDNNCVLLIRVRSEDVAALSQTVDYKWLDLQISAMGNGKYITCSAIAVLHPLRYGTDIPKTQIA